MSSILDALQGPGGPQGGAPAPDAGGSADDLLDTAISSLSAYLDHSGSDDVDTATAAQCLAKLQSIKATSQKNEEAAMGTTGAHKAMAKQIGNIAGSVYGG